MTLFHGARRNTLTAHAGICLTSDVTAAATYGRGQSFRVEADLSGLVSRSFVVGQADRDNNRYPGDTDEQVAELVAAGVDYLVYDDQTEQGREHDCYRLLSPAALARLDASSAVLVDRDGDVVTDEE